MEKNGNLKNIDAFCYWLQARMIGEVMIDRISLAGEATVRLCAWGAASCTMVVLFLRIYNIVSIWLKKRNSTPAHLVVHTCLVESIHHHLIEISKETMPYRMKGGSLNGLKLRHTFVSFSRRGWSALTNHGRSNIRVWWCNWGRGLGADIGFVFLSFLAVTVRKEMSLSSCLDGNDIGWLIAVGTCLIWLCTINHYAENVKPG